MHDIKAIRDNPGAFDKGLARRGLPPMAAEILSLDHELREHIQTLQTTQALANTEAKAVGTAVRSGDSSLIEAAKAKVTSIKRSILSGEQIERDLRKKLTDALAVIPNLPLDEVPDGKNEHDNVEVRRWGTPPQFAFEPRQHFDIGEWLGLMDFESAAKLAGARFVVMKGQLARLERVLAQFMVDLQTAEHGYTEHYVPYLVNDQAMYGTGQLPKFAEDLFRTADGRWLIPTAEVSLTNLVRERTLEERELPLRLTAYTPCFRAEAGAAGRDTRGMIRQHQFSKVELVSITTPEQSRQELERMTVCAEEVLKRLDLHHRTVRLCTADIGFGSRMTYDIEVWLPGQKAFREISSCSACGDFQARRMEARYKPAGGKGTRYVHTLNGSGLAVGRTLIAVLENYQNADGGVTIPEALRPLMGGAEKIARP
ncbi:MAG: serine--tRNA ligase [Hyphomicrobiales bacterium]